MGQLTTLTHRGSDCSRHWRWYHAELYRFSARLGVAGVQWAWSRIFQKFMMSRCCRQVAGQRFFC